MGDWQCVDVPFAACIMPIQGSPPAMWPPPSNDTGQEAHNLWAGEVSLDVERAHAIAPLASIILMTTPTAETLGVQRFPDFRGRGVQAISSPSSAPAASRRRSASR